MRGNKKFSLVWGSIRHTTGAMKYKNLQYKRDPG